MKRIILGLVGAGLLASAAPAMSQDWRDYNHDRYEHRYDRSDRYDRDHRYDRHRRHDDRFAYRRTCGWRYGERTCWTGPY